MSKKKIKKILFWPAAVIGGLVVIIMIVTIFMNISLWVRKNIDPGAKLELFGTYPLVVETNSMKGEFQRGDLIFVKAIDANQVKVGDVISFVNIYSEDRSIVTHRVMDLSENYGVISFTTKGDANRVNDYYPVTENNVIGIYKFNIPYLGLLILFLQKPVGLILSISVIFLIFIIINLFYAYKSKLIRVT